MENKQRSPFVFKDYLKKVAPIIKKIATLSMDQYLKHRDPYMGGYSVAADGIFNSMQLEIETFIVIIESTGIDSIETITDPQKGTESENEGFESDEINNYGDFGAYEVCIYSIGDIVVDRAKYAINQSTKIEDQETIIHYYGYLSCIRDIMVLMQNETKTFGISYEDVALEDIEPDIDLFEHFDMDKIPKELQKIRYDLMGMAE